MKTFISRQWFACVLLLIVGASGAVHGENSPNVVLVVVENLGAHDLSSDGSKFHHTPILDQLAKEGMKFTQAYSAATSERPSQASLLTGKSAARLQMSESSPGGLPVISRRLLPVPSRRELSLSEVTCAELLKAKGYKTVFLGNWWLGEGKSAPDHQGFDSVMRAPTDPLALLTQAETFVTEHLSHPFFVTLFVNPIQIPAERVHDSVAQYSLQKPTGLQRNPEYAARLELLDRNLGQFFQKLDELKSSRQTLVLVTSTNGGLATAQGNEIPRTNNAPSREGKGFLYEGGIRVPLIIRAKGMVKPGVTCDQLVSGEDVLPTIAEACGAKVSPDIDGVSLMPLLKGENRAVHSSLFWHMPAYSPEGGRPSGAIREGQFKLLEFFETGRLELFKVGTEPGEGMNLTDKEPERTARMAKQLGVWREKVKASLPEQNPGYQPPGQAADGSITLPASEADVHGIMLRYEPLPHKNTLGFWVRSEDWASCKFQVKTPGQFQLQILQGCGTKSGGSRVEFRVSDQAVTTIVEETGGFQQFKSRQIGTIEISTPGIHTLVVKPLSKPGVAVMDLREVRLIPLP